MVPWLLINALSLLSASPASFPSQSFSEHKKKILCCNSASKSFNPKTQIFREQRRVPSHRNLFLINHSLLLSNPNDVPSTNTVCLQEINQMPCESEEGIRESFTRASDEWTILHTEQSRGDTPCFTHALRFDACWGNWRWRAELFIHHRMDGVMV